MWYKILQKAYCFHLLHPLVEIEYFIYLLFYKKATFCNIRTLFPARIYVILYFSMLSKWVWEGFLYSYKTKTEALKIKRRRVAVGSLQWKIPLAIIFIENFLTFNLWTLWLSSTKICLAITIRVKLSACIRAKFSYLFHLFMYYDYGYFKLVIW